MRKRWGIWVLFLLGFLCCCLPLLAHLYSQKEQEQVIATYQKTIQDQKLDVKELRKQAEHYNSKAVGGAGYYSGCEAANMGHKIAVQTNGAALSGEDALLLGDASYASLLDTTETGVMGSMDIPKIGVELPIYHGTSEEVLSKGIGHLQGSSLPVGGESTHSILTGHRGLPQSKLLTRLDELEEGDYFFFHVLDETLAYQVTEIQVVKPEAVSVLKIQEGQDLASIITCTPYGLNTHRLIVTGKRVPYEAKQANSIGEELPSARELVFTLLPFAFLLLFLLYIWRERRRTINEAKDDDKI